MQRPAFMPILGGGGRDAFRGERLGSERRRQDLLVLLRSPCSRIMQTSMARRVQGRVNKGPFDQSTAAPQSASTSCSPPREARATGSSHRRHFGSSLRIRHQHERGERRGRTAPISNVLTCPSAELQPRTMWCGWNAMLVIGATFWFKNPTASRYSSARSHGRGARERTAVAELGNGLSLLVPIHVPDFDDVESRAPALTHQRPPEEREVQERTSQRWAHAHERPSGSSHPDAPGTSSPAPST